MLVRVRAIARVRVRAIARVRVRVGARGPPVDESEVARQLAVESMVKEHELDVGSGLVRVRVRVGVRVRVRIRVRVGFRVRGCG